LNNKLSKQANINTTLYYTHGEGYYAEFRYNDKLSNYGLPAITTGDTITLSRTTSDLTRQRWLSNNLIGLNTNYTYENENSIFTFGLSANHYVGQHYGIVDTVFSANQKYIQSNLPLKYYQNTAYKTDISVFVKYTQKISKNLNYYIDLQGRKVLYTGSGIENNFQKINFTGNYSFMNPKAGLNYQFNTLSTRMGIFKSELNSSFGMGYKEPARTDFTDNINTSIPKPEQLLDYELGYHFDLLKRNDIASLFNMNINGYYMDYRNQLVLTGAVNDVGSALRVNVPKSYRTGIEIEGSALIFDNSLKTIKKISHEIRLIGNIALSKNIIEHSPASWLDYATYEKVDSTFHNAAISYSPNHVGSIGIDYNIRFWERTKTENKTISVSKSRINIRFMTKFVGKQYLDNTGDESRKLDEYHFSEMTINYNHVLKNNKSLNFKFQMNNLFNQYYANNGYTWGYMYGSRNVIQEVYLFPSASRNINFSIGYTF
jgi:iron complex outermembrane receptor protein